jgi:hypothetical protein
LKSLPRNPSHPPFFKGRRVLGASALEDSIFSPFGKGGKGGFYGFLKK